MPKTHLLQTQEQKTPKLLKRARHTAAHHFCPCADHALFSGLGAYFCSMAASHYCLPFTVTGSCTYFPIGKPDSQNNCSHCPRKPETNSVILRLTIRTTSGKHRHPAAFRLLTFCLIFLIRVSRSGNGISRYPFSSDNPEDHVSVLPASTYRGGNDDPWG